MAAAAHRLPTKLHCSVKRDEAHAPLILAIDPA